MTPTEISRRITAVEGSVTNQGVAISDLRGSISEHTQTIEALTGAVNGIVDLLEPGIIKGLSVAYAPSGRVQEGSGSNAAAVKQAVSEVTIQAARITGAPVTRLKMRLNSVTQAHGGDNPLDHVSFQACGDDPVFGKYTPNGNLNFSVIPEVASKLVMGAVYHIDLVPVE